MLEKSGCIGSCPLSYAVSTFSGKWKPFIIWHISLTPRHEIRYGALMAALPRGVSHKMLTQHLRELERDGIVTRRVDDDEAVLRVSYALTEKGSTLAVILYLLRDWGALYGDFEQAAPENGRGRIEEAGITYFITTNPDDKWESETESIVWRTRRGEDAPVSAVQ